MSTDDEDSPPRTTSARGRQGGRERPAQVEFFRFTAEDVSGAGRWPDAVPLPAELAEVTRGAPKLMPVLPLDGGAYHGCYPNGQLRFLARLEKRHLAEYVVLAEDLPQGRWQKGLDAEVHLPTGSLEIYRDETDFDLAHHSTRRSEYTFEDWVRGHLPRVAVVDDPGTLGSPLSMGGEVTPRMKFLVTRPHPSVEGWCRRELHATGVGRDFCNLVPPACSWVLAPPERRPEYQCALVPTWQGLGAVDEVAMDRLPLYAFTRNLAETLGNSKQPPGGYPGGICISAGRVLPAWVKVHSDANPVQLAHRGRLPWPVLWTLPEHPEECCGFWLAQHHVNMLLLQEITRDTELADLASAARGTGFVRCASVAGAFLLGLSGCGTMAPDPSRRPWKDRPSQLADLQADLADLMASLQHPLLPSLGAWAWRRGGMRSDAPQAAKLLGRYLTQRRASLEERLRAARRGVLYWESTEEQEWGRPGQRKPSGSASMSWSSRAWEAAADLHSREPAALHDTDSFTAGLAERLPVVGHYVTATGNPREAADLEAYLRRHAGLTREHWTVVHRIFGMRVALGPGYTALLVGALWALSGIEPRAWERPEWMEPAVRLTHWMLPLL